MPVVKLNARNITTLQAVGGVRTDYRDELLPGFFLRVTPQGTRTFGIVYTTRDGRLGDVPRAVEKRHRSGGTVKISNGALKVNGFVDLLTS